jgi:hypothetical protein
VTDASSIYQRARADVAAMLGYDLDNLTPEQATRLDVSTALRVLLDNQSARLVRGESLDARELLMASEALSRLLPPLREPVPDTNREDPRAYMWRTYCEMRARGAAFGEGLDGAKLRIERLTAEIASKDARIAELEATLAGSVPLPPNVVPLARPPTERTSERSEVSPRPPQPPKPVTGGLLTDDAPEPWREHLNRNFDPWADNRT